ncbi:hypothetical protein CEXT_671201 [Caerostris extrusa]|uniref:Uncharacterized protein n=1 Tax=Caerostris extrusa TaxID=172846 RepID=A0AAV4NBR9_CAEEX|nr:hypothetical protein CEXT_671201 [Caerostris extrusa]
MHPGSTNPRGGDPQRPNRLTASRRGEGGKTNKLREANKCRVECRDTSALPRPWVCPCGSVRLRRGGLGKLSSSAAPPPPNDSAVK